MKRYLIPLAVFVALAALLAVGLNLDPRKVPSPLVGKPAPAFELPRLQASQQRVTHAEAARAALGAQRLGFVVRALPGRASAGDAAGA